MIIIKTCKNCVENKDFCKNCISYSNQVEHTPEEHKASIQRMKEAGLQKAAEQTYFIKKGAYNKQFNDMFEGIGYLSSEDIWNGLTYPDNSHLEEETWIRLSRKLNNSEELTLEEEYTFELAAKRAGKLATYNLQGLKISSLAKTSDEALGSNSASGGTSRGRAYIGTETIKVLKGNNKYIKQLKQLNKKIKTLTENRYDTFKNLVEYETYLQAKSITKQQIIKELEKSTLYIDEDIYVTGTHLGTHPFKQTSLATYNSIGNNTLVKINKKVHKDIKQNTEDFYGTYDLKKANFVGHVHKKSCGRDPTGHLSASPKETRKWAHNVMIILTPNTITQATNKKVEMQYFDLDTKNRGPKFQREVAKVSHGTPCYNVYSQQGHAGISNIPVVCMTNYKLKDMRRGDIVCPVCGLVHGIATEI